MPPVNQMQQSPLGPIPQEGRRRADWQRATAAIERVHHKQRVAERDREPAGDGRGVRLQEHRRSRGSAETAERQQQPSARARPERDTPNGRQGPERAAG